MKSNLFSLLAMFVLSISVISSCTPTLTQEELLAEGKWILVAQTIDPPSTFLGTTPLTSDVFNDVLKDCQKDNVYDYQDNGDLQIDEGPTKCEPTSAQTVISSWTINDGRLVVSDNQGVVISQEIKTLSLTEMILSVNINYLPEPHEITLTYQKR